MGRVPASTGRSGDQVEALVVIVQRLSGCRVTLDALTPSPVMVNFLTREIWINRSVPAHKVAEALFYALAKLFRYDDGTYALLESFQAASAETIPIPVRRPQTALRIGRKEKP